jgi:hypothetical protein
MTTAELQAKADLLDSNRIVMDLPRADSNDLVKLGRKLQVHGRRIERLDIASLADHETLLTIVAGIDTIVQGINGDDADWQDYRAKYEVQDAG